MKRWQLQKAKDHFSELVDEALVKGPQTVTRHGTPVVVVVSLAEFERRRVPKGSLVDFFRRSPLAGVTLDLSRDERWDRDLEP